MGKTRKMATMALRSLCRQGRHFRTLSCAQSPRIPTLSVLNQMRFISTSKNDKNVGASIETIEKTDENEEENYTSYGYAPGDRDEDWFHHHYISFMVFTMTFFSVGFLFVYRPDPAFSDWCYREAFLQMERNERQGKPLIDCNYVDPASIELPSDEELGDTEIII